MYKEQLEKHWEIIKAFKEGKIVQYEINKGCWKDTASPAFDITTNYRIKPSPEYIPFDFSDARELIGKIITTKMRRSYYLITSVDVAGVVFGGHYNDYVVMFDDYQFLDGSPCGKLKE